MGLPFTTSKLKWLGSLTFISNTDSKALDVGLILSFELHGLGQATFVSSSSFMEMFSGNMILLYCTVIAKANITSNYSFCQLMCLSCLCLVFLNDICWRKKHLLLLLKGSRFVSILLFICN